MLYVFLLKTIIIKYILIRYMTLINCLTLDAMIPSVIIYGEERIGKSKGTFL